MLKTIMFNQDLSEQYRGPLIDPTIS